MFFFSKKKSLLVYIVDDVKMQTEQLEALVEKDFDAEVVKFQSPQAVLKALSKAGKLPDLMLCDYSMPEMTGTQLKREIFKNYGKFPVIFITGTHNEDIIEDQLVVFSKPINRSLLINQITRMLDRSFIVK